MLACSTGSENLWQRVRRDEAHLPITGDGPLSTRETFVLPENTSRIRVGVRDIAAGKVGCQDFSLREILSATRSQDLIR